MSQEEENLRLALEEAQQTIAILNQYIKELEGSVMVSTRFIQHVAADDDGNPRCLVMGKNGPTVVPLAGELQHADIPFAAVLAQSQATGAVYDFFPVDYSVGEEATVVEVYEKVLEVESAAGKGFIVKDPSVEKYREGDRVVTDGSMVLRYLGASKKKHAITESTNVKWEDIGGLEDAKQALREAVEVPFQHQELFESYGKKPTKGVLLYGPPGCGKTLLAKATATALANVHGETHDSAFIYVKGPEILNKWVGESESKIRSLFARAREHKEKHGYPAVIFIDEADAILMKRGSGRVSGMETTIVPQFLAEMDGFHDSSAVVLLATNRADTLDSAITRDGRVDRKIFVGRPDADTALEILLVHMAKTTCCEDAREMSEKAVEHIYDPEKTGLVDLYWDEENRATFGLPDILNGAMLEGIVQSATMNAIYRDIRSDGEPSGVRYEDLEQAIDRMVAENAPRDFKDELKEFADTYFEGKRPKNVVRIQR